MIKMAETEGYIDEGCMQSLHNSVVPFLSQSCFVTNKKTERGLGRGEKEGTVHFQSLRRRFKL